jgi:hypothetical protein
MAKRGMTFEALRGVHGAVGRHWARSSDSERRFLAEPHPFTVAARSTPADPPAAALRERRWRIAPGLPPTPPRAEPMPAQDIGIEEKGHQMMRIAQKRGLRDLASRRILPAVRSPNLTPQIPLSSDAALSPFKALHWLALTPAERLRRSWALRSRLPDPRAVHDRKLFPKP